MVVDNNNFVEVVKEFGHEETQAQKIVIIGGGNIGYSLSKAVEDGEHKIATNIINAMCPSIYDNGLFGVELFVLKNGDSDALQTK